MPFRRGELDLRAVHVLQREIQVGRRSVGRAAGRGGPAPRRCRAARPRDRERVNTARRRPLRQRREQPRTLRRFRTLDGDATREPALQFYIALHGPLTRLEVTQYVTRILPAAPEVLRHRLHPRVVLAADQHVGPARRATRFAAGWPANDVAAAGMRRACGHHEERHRLARRGGTSRAPSCRRSRGSAARRRASAPAAATPAGTADAPAVVAFPAGSDGAARRPEPCVASEREALQVVERESGDEQRGGVREGAEPDDGGEAGRGRSRRPA